MNIYYITGLYIRSQESGRRKKVEEEKFFGKKILV